MIWKGLIYDGEWANNMPNGVGQLVWLFDNLDVKYNRNMYIYILFYYFSIYSYFYFRVFLIF